MSRERIVRAGLAPSRKMSYPTTEVGDRMVIREYILDPTWVRGYFSAVHVLTADSVRVGPSVGQVVPCAPSNPVLIERVDVQIVTFVWPEGVKSVEAYQGPRGQTTIDPATSQVIATLTREHYMRLGGMQITRPLPSNGCSLHLFGVLWGKAAVPADRPASPLTTAG